MSDLGKLTAHAHYSLRGDTELVLAPRFRSTPQAQWKQLGQTILTLDGLHGEVTSVKPSDPAATHDPFELDMDFTQSNFLDWSSKKSKAPLPLLAIGLPDPPENSDATDRARQPARRDRAAEARLPPEFTAQPPIAVSVARDYAEFKSSYQFRGPHGHRRTLARFQDARTARRRALDDFQAFARAVTADENQPLVVENSAPGAPALPSDATAGRSFRRGPRGLNSGNARRAIPLFERAVQLDPSTSRPGTISGSPICALENTTKRVPPSESSSRSNPSDEARQRISRRCA